MDVSGFTFPASDCSLLQTNLTDIRCLSDFSDNLVVNEYGTHPGASNYAKPFHCREKVGTKKEKKKKDIIYIHVRISNIWTDLKKRSSAMKYSL